MKQRPRVLMLLVVQLVLVLSIAAKYVYERKTCARVWTRATQFDPNEPLRGRYLALQLLVDACSLPRVQALDPRGVSTWDVSLTVRNGHLVPQLENRAINSENTEQISLGKDGVCSLSPLSSREEYFIPDTARDPFPLKADQQLWVEVTVPPAGPPRPIQLAVSDQAGFHPLQFD